MMRRPQTLLWLLTALSALLLSLLASFVLFGTIGTVSLLLPLLWLSHLLNENSIFDISFSKYGTYYKQMIGTAPIYLETYEGELIYA